VGGFITAAGVAAAFSGVRTDLDLNTEVSALLRHTATTHGASISLHDSYRMCN